MALFDQLTGTLTSVFSDQQQLLMEEYEYSLAQIKLEGLTNLHFSSLNETPSSHQF